MAKRHGPKGGSPQDLDRRDYVRPGDDGYDEYEEYDEYDRGFEYVYDDELARKRANLGCLIAFLVVLAIVGGAVLFGVLYVTGEIGGKKATATAPVVLEVAPGSGGTIVGSQLKEAGLISNENIFRFYVRFNDAGTSFQTGEHELTPGMSYDEIIAKLSEPPPPKEAVRVTIPEGSTVAQFATALEKAGVCNAQEFIDVANDVERFSDIKFFSHVDYDPDTYMKAEGYLAPNTYDFYIDDDPERVARVLFEQFDSEITDDLYARMEELNMTLRQVVTLASVVEEECSDPAEQPKVASVFVNRAIGDMSYTDLERRTLGSDATTRYLADWVSRGHGFNGQADFEGMTLDSMKEKMLTNSTTPGDDAWFYAYYSGDNDPKTREALDMAGPISAPSSTAILAVLYPEASNNFYFLSNKYGEYRYAQYYNQHEANIAWMYETNEQYDAEEAAGTLDTGDNSEG